MINHVAAFVLLSLVTASSALGQPPTPAQPVPAQARPAQPVPPTLPTPGSPAQAAPVPPPPPPAPPAVRPPPVQRLGQAVNVRVDVTITDQSGKANPLRKTVTVVTADRLNGRIRSGANYANIGEVPLNVDVEPALLQNGRILLALNLQYDLPGTPPTEDKLAAAGTPVLRRTAIQENLHIVLDSGKPMIAAQSADPVGDRQVTVEVTATILK